MTWTGLHDAVQHGDVQEVLRSAQRNSEQARFVDDHGSTPLHMACWGKSDLCMIHALIDAYPEGVMDCNTHGDTPIHVLLSSPNANPEVLRALLNASPTAAAVQNKEGLMPLHKVCRHDAGNHEILELLLEACPHATRTPIKMGDPAPRRMHSLGERKGTDHFLLPGAVPLSSSPDSAMELEFRDRRRQVRDGAYPLHMALASKKATPETIQMLVHASPEVLSMTNKFGETPVHVALANDAPPTIVEMLVCNPEDQAGCPKTPETLCGSAALLMAESRHGNLPIHVAAKYGCHVSVALLLVEVKPETIGVTNNDGMTPYELAMLSGKCNVDVLGLWKLQMVND